MVLAGCKLNLEKKPNLTAFVDPFIGTGGHGHTYPGFSMPFGMVQLSPDTRLSGWDGCSGYHYSDSIIYGFSHTHLSGTGVSDYGDILFMPTAGNTILNNGSDGTKGYSSRFSHANEEAIAGYYSVFLDDPKVFVELTGTHRVGFHKYSFKGNEPSNIILDLVHRDQVISSNIRVVSENEIEGSRLSNAWAKEQHIYFVAHFSENFESFGLSKGSKILSGHNEVEGEALKAYFKFGDEKEILLKVGISAVSIEGARKNLIAEIPDWDFDQTRENAKNSWNDKLNTIKVVGEEVEKKKIFYTALYHSLLAPNLFMDIDSNYRGTDLKVHKAISHTNYSVFSLWDTFRATHPLFTIIEREKTLDFIKTFLAQYKNGGQLPVWELAGNYTGCMIGYHAIPVIADAFVKGITEFDQDLALKAMKHSAEQDHLGLGSYNKYGYIRAEDEPESVSKTLEYAYDDWCIGKFAKEIGDSLTHQTYMERAQYYKNIYDSETGFMRAKVNGTWFAPFDPSEVNFNYTEANAWQYSLFAPHDIGGLVKIMGGPEKLEAYLDNLFSASKETTGRKQVDITGLIGQYAHGNEPSHHMAYLYNYIGKPHKTQARIHEIMESMYTANPDGLSGNEDCGQMSSWYVLSAMGFYSVTPGQDYYTFGTPMFKTARINLENGNTFKITANNLSSKNHFIASIKLNGKEYNKTYIKHQDILNGGTLVFNMTNSQNDLNVVFEPPVSDIKTKDILPAPFFKAISRTFTDNLEITIGSADKECKIYYTLDGTEPSVNSSVYKDVLKLSHSATLRAIAYKDGVSSFINSGNFNKLDEEIKINIKSKYANQYSAGGDNALIDKIKGGANYRTGSWQGYQEDLEVIIDLGSLKPIKQISAGFIQDIRSWIWYPKHIEYFASNNNRDFRLLAKVENKISDEDYNTSTQELNAEFPSLKFRYLMIRAENYGLIPDWHLGNGGTSWIFIDEISIN